jgi:c-di-GMP-specific phosphodiesterase
VVSKAAVPGGNEALAARESGASRLQAVPENFVRMQREFTQQQQVLERIARGEPLPETLADICRHVEERYPETYCTVLTVDRAAGVLRHGASPTLAREFAEEIDGLPVGEGMGACGAAAARGEVVVVNDVLNDTLTAAFLDLANRFKLGSVWSYPLLNPGGEVLGTFAVYRKNRHTPSRTEINFVTKAGHLATLAVDRARSETALQTAANFDSLTGLVNRARFLELVTAELQLPDRSIGLMFLEIDRFQQINDSLGYIAGDRILVEFARRIKEVLGPHGLTARFGGDLFTAMIAASDSRPLQDLADQVLESVCKPFVVDGVELFVTASVGVATGGPQTDALGLVRDADAAMHAARAGGPGRRHLYDRELRSQVLRRLRTETELRRAIDRRELVMHYQPILNVLDGSWSGVEALVRWQHPRRGLVGPDGFIPLAEETGLIVPLGEVILELVCEQAKIWAQTLPGIHIGVNASVVQLAHPSAAADIERMLEQSGLAPSSLMLEVTESALMEKLDSTRASLDRLVDDGVNVLIDDFGTGYSSLARLRELPISGLKIDRRFVRDLGVDPAARPVVQAIANLARAYGLEVVVEGVEDAAALAIIVDLGCEYAQGYHLGRPGEPEAIEAQLTQPIPIWVGLA